MWNIRSVRSYLVGEQTREKFSLLWGEDDIFIDKRTFAE